MSDERQVEEILAQARAQVTARQLTHAHERWGGPLRWVLLGLILILLAAFLAAPGTLAYKLLLAMGGVCALRPDHSYFIGNLQLPLEARMTGIYGGFLLTLLTLLLLKRWGAQRLGTKLIIALLALFFLSMAFDGLNSTFAELNLPHLYQPTNTLRLATGLLSGIAIAPALLWLLNVVATPRTPRTQAVVQSGWELLLFLLICTLFGGLVIQASFVFYLPVALISVGGIITTLMLTVLLVVVVLGGLEGRVVRFRQLQAPAELALLLSVALLAGLATLRWSFIDTPPHTLF